MSSQARATGPVPLIVSVDTEEDNWNRAREAITLDNIRELPRLDRCFERLGVRATYFTTYQVAVQPDACDILRGLGRTGRAEIAAHLHPWNTPPLTEPFEPRASMLMNLSGDLQLAKLQTLTAALEVATGERPRAFRAGRWGLGPETVAALVACGYRIDSSVTPFQSWQAYGGPSYVGAPLDAYRIEAGRDPRVPAPEGALLEIPVSWAYSRRPWRVWGRVHRLIASPALRSLRLMGVAARLAVVKPLALSPESHTAADMLTLSRRLLDDGVGHLHLFFHSPSLLPGLSPFVSSAAAVERLYQTIETYLEGLARETSFAPATISEAGDLLDPAPAWARGDA